MQLNAVVSFYWGTLCVLRLQVMKEREWDCLVMHDVDLLPDSEDNRYRCRLDEVEKFSCLDVQYTNTQLDRQRKAT